MRKIVLLCVVLREEKSTLIRRIFPIFSFAFLVLLFLVSCKKESIPDIPPDLPKEDLVVKVKSWLDIQKKGLSIADTMKIESLKRSLNYVERHLEPYKNWKNLLVVPISNEFHSKNNQDKNVTNYLVLVVNNKDSIENGNIIQYISSSHQKVAPQKTFSKIFNYQDIDCSGVFTILSITDNFRYELKFDNGKLKSVTELKKKEQPKDGSGRVNACIDWYEQTWYVWSDGTAILISEVYVFTTCGEECAQPRFANGRSYATNCGGNGGGGGIDYDVCVSSAISSFQYEANEARVSSETKRIDVSDIDEVTKNKNVTWTILNGAYRAWELNSEEIGVIKLIDQSQNKWAWKSLRHGHITMEGSPLPTTSIEYNQGVGTPSFTPETAETSTVLYAGMSLNFGVTYRLICNCPNVPLVGWFPPIHRNYNATSTLWDSQPY